MSGNLAKNQSINVLNTFAQTQLAWVKRREIRESTFLEFAACAFFSGAEQLLRKQSQLDSEQSLAVLLGLIKEICKADEYNARGLVESVARLSEKYFLIENLVEQGATAAEQWLNCEETQDKALQKILVKYQHTTMFELGIEGISEKHEAQQHELYSQIDHSVQDIRSRSIKIVALVFVLIAAIVATAVYFGLIDLPF